LGGWGWGEEDHRGKEPFSSHYIKGVCSQQDLLLMINLGHLTKVLFGFFTIKLAFFPPLGVILTLSPFLIYIGSKPISAGSFSQINFHSVQITLFLKIN
jgi:hypothetical protein